MADPTLSDLQERIRRFRDERDWAQFHTLKDLAAGIAIEAAELQEILLWQRPDDESELLRKRRDEIEAELADVLIQIVNFSLAADVDLGKAVLRKINENEIKYPVAEARGRAAKYPDL
ncbi:MAG: MazG-like family protein [Gaiellaceae bacterium]